MLHAPLEAKSFPKNTHIHPPTRTQVAAEKAKLQTEISMLRRATKLAPILDRYENSLASFSRRDGEADSLARVRRSKVKNAKRDMGVSIFDSLQIGDQNETQRVFNQFKATVDGLEAQIAEKMGRIEQLDYTR